MQRRELLTGAACALILPAILPARSFAIESNYPRAVANVLVSEGERYENHPADPGGPTKYGITIYDVRLYVKKGATADDVRALTKAQALEIYHEKYWLHRCVRGDALPAGVDYSVFDYGVNAGVSRAGKVLRQVLALSADSGTVTDGVLAALELKDAQTLIRAIAAERRRFYAALIRNRPASAVFRKGWLARAAGVEAVSLRMAGAPPSIGLFGEEIEELPAFGPGKAWSR